MKFSLQFLLLAISWIAICLAVTQAEVVWAADLVAVIGRTFLSLSVLTPFVAEERHRPFWTAYAITVAALLITPQHANTLSGLIIQSLPNVRSEMLTYGDGYIDFLEPIGSPSGGRFSSELLWMILPANVIFAAGIFSGVARTLLTKSRFVIAALTVGALILIVSITGPSVFIVPAVFAGWMLLLLTLSWAASTQSESKRFWITYCLATSILLITFWTGQLERSVLRPLVSSIYSITGVDSTTIKTVALMVKCLLIFVVVPCLGLATAWILEVRRNASESGRKPSVETTSADENRIAEESVRRLESNVL